VISPESAETLVNSLRERAVFLSGAESCTGGLVAAAITAIPGSSEAFLGCVVAYSESAKSALLGVKPEILAAQGAVSEACVKAMAEAALGRFNADIAYAISGIAGPGGGGPEQPVGTVWTAYATTNDTLTELLSLAGDRDHIRARCADIVLHRLDALVRERFMLDNPAHRGVSLS
jgi:nicotinamide-nucleotide amidase